MCWSGYVGPWASWIVRFEQKKFGVVSLNRDEDDTARILATETPIAFQTETGHSGREI